MIRTLWSFSRTRRSAEIRQLPSILRCEWMLAGPTRMNRCLPRLSTSSTVWPVRSAAANRGTRTSQRVNALPTNPSRRLAAVSHTVSPSGMLSPPKTPRRADESGVGQRGRNLCPLTGLRRLEHRHAVNPLDQNRRNAAADHEFGQRAGGGAVRLGVRREVQKRTAAALEKPHQFAVDKNDQRAGLAARPM